MTVALVTTACVLLLGLAAALPGIVSAASANGAPWINIVAPQDGAVYRLDKPLTAKFKCERNGTSQVASCTGTVNDGASVDTSQVGQQTFTVTTTDELGHSHSKTVTYTDVYTWNGFFAPVASKDQSILNTVKAGQVVRIKFSLDGNRGTSVLQREPTSTQVTCPSWATHAAETGAKPTGADMAYSRTMQYYIYSWQTDPSWAGTCRDFRLRLADGTAAHVATFQFT
jgi:hypothetical protein